MTEEEILEDNKLIAEFMGAEKSHFGDYLIYPINTDKNAFGKTDYSDVKYHSSWDWLMPVLEKIRDMKNESAEYMTQNSKVASALATVRIWFVYKAVIEFIKWHKTQIK
jgi:hypothetical protein